MYIFINLQTLRYTTNKIPILLFRNKTNKACVSNELTDLVDPDMVINYYKYYIL